MDNFIFSVNVTIPIFLIILLGYILRRIGFLTDEFVRVANKYVFIVALPVMLFRDIAGSDVRKDMNVKFFLFCMIVTIIMFFLVWGIAKLTLKDKTMVGAFAQAGARGSAAILGVAFVENICGEIGMTPLMIVAAVPFFNILSVIILVFNANTEANKDYGKIKNACINIAKNPIIIGIVLGLIASLVRLPIPTIPARTLNYVAQTATPIALLAVGVAGMLQRNINVLAHLIAFGEGCNQIVRKIVGIQVHNANHSMPSSSLRSRSSCGKSSLPVRSSPDRKSVV